MHSATKFISEHSDLMAGVLAIKGESLAKELYFLQNAEGTGLAPFHCCVFVYEVLRPWLFMVKNNSCSLPALRDISCSRNHNCIGDLLFQLKPLLDDATDDGLARISGHYQSEDK